MTDGKLRRENDAAVRKKRGSFGPMSRWGISCQALSESREERTEREAGPKPRTGWLNLFCDGDHPVAAAVVNLKAAMCFGFKSTAPVAASEPHADDPH